ncbi:MAG: hypothetical protein AAFR75_02895 [Pseudomonadota bacterium]
MTQIISYPHYCPDKFGLRALLLFYDDISTIVPYEDQEFVKRREYIDELSDVSKRMPISLVDPSYSMFAWEHDEKTFGSFMNLATESSGQITADLRKLVRKMLDGKHHWDDQSVSDKLQDSGWMFVAAQKITPETLDKLKALDVALPTPMLISHETGQIIEHQPILMPSELGDFAISRLARDIGIRDRQVPVTLENSSHYASLYRGGIDLPHKRHYLLSSLIGAAIPAELGELPSGQYWELREQYAGVRQSLNNLVAETMRSNDLDGSDDFGEFIGRSEAVIEDLRSEIARVSERIHPAWVEKTRAFVIDTSFTLTGTAVGYALGDFAGAMAGLGLGKLSSKASSYFTTRSDDLASQIGHMRARISQSARRPAYKVPSYMI